MSEFILEMKNINKSFFGVQVLYDVSLDVLAGEVHVLAGENGAGKSTLMRVLSGACRCESGNIKVDGKLVHEMTPREALQMGISVIYQEFNLIPFLPIYENIFLGKELVQGMRINKKDEITQAAKYLEKVGCNLDPRTIVNDISVAQKQLIEIAKALSNDVKILVLDEPTASISDKETQLLFSIIRELKKKHIGIIYISHRMSEFYEIGDRCTIMRDGKSIKTVFLKDTTEQDITKMMVGRDVDFIHEPNNRVEYKSPPILQVKNLNYKKTVKNVSFDLYKGEILGFSGLVGAGRTEVAKSLIGAYRKDSGTVLFKGKPVSNNLGINIREGLVYLSEDRKDEGLILIHDLVNNISLPNLRQIANPFINKQLMVHNAKDYIKELNIKSTSCYQETCTLSGGNQQKAVIAKWLYSQANVYIFDEPTRGIDVGARDEIYRIMYSLLDIGASIILISSDLVEIKKMCDRIVVMREGCITQVLVNKDTLTQEEIIKCAL
ncbi:sugar ABC transporter ATP-binding protein [Treponema parvum]|uniref:Sugar ABC transporter ATP-binding protein n=1 Tax=Treponema parvum TaxID=138851 RepID=A0A975F3F2_9SPIR|nr:sugar ABC transporter ATP-binding protein [Treponema parvum]QTQ13985.1 sugar ABC transporter ATP-binding protein [Treponema parvum]